MAQFRILLGVVGAAILASPAAWADDAAGAGPLGYLQQLSCKLNGPCSPETAPAPSPEAQAGPAPEAASKADDADPALPKTPAKDRAPRRKVAAAKPVLTIAAGETERAHLKALTTIVPGQPVKILPIASQAATADFLVGVQPDDGASAGGKSTLLFTEQVHVIAGAGFKQFKDLDGRVVSFGPEGSAGQAVARRLFKALNIKVNETALDLTNALDGISTGDIDAVVLLAPAPFEPVNALGRANLHLLPLPDAAALPAGLVVAEIAPQDYPGLKATAPIKTAAVPAVLSLSAKGARQPAAKRLFAAVNEKSVALSKQGFDLLRADAGQAGSTQFAHNEDR